MSQTNYESLQIYQIAVRLADSIWETVVKWDYFAKDTLGKQLVRSADSISANIAEGNGRGSAVDHRKFLRQARGSLYETKSFLSRAHSRKLISNEAMANFDLMIEELVPKLNAYISRVTNTIQDQKTKGHP